jgi:hypothetical protein
MADKQTEADKAAAMKEYRQQHDAAVDRIAALRAARLERDAKEASEPKPAPVKAAPRKASSATKPKAAAKTAAKSAAKAKRG